MNAKLEPRKATDRGGWLCMPLVINGPEGKPGWKKVRCPECGTLCWQRPEDAGVVKASHLDGAVCTKCALRKAGDVDETQFDVQNLEELRECWSEFCKEEKVNPGCVDYVERVS